MLWQGKHPTSTLDMKQLNNKQYIIMKKHSLWDLNLEKLSGLIPLKDTAH